MSLITIFAIALGLAMDAFAVSISVGGILPRLTFHPVFRLSFHFGLFQFFMPILGWLAGLTIQKWIAAYDHWISFALLAFIGGKMIYESFQVKALSAKTDPSRGWSLVILSVATSIDAFAVGLTMAMLSVTVWMPSLIIGLVAAAMTILGMHLGQQLGKWLGRKMELIGGFILIAIGSKILLEHLFG
jgi:manganese efflux pump family protein